MGRDICIVAHANRPLHHKKGTSIDFDEYIFERSGSLEYEIFYRGSMFGPIADRIDHKLNLSSSMEDCPHKYDIDLADMVKIKMCFEEYNDRYGYSEIAYDEDMSYEDYCEIINDTISNIDYLVEIMAENPDWIRVEYYDSY